MELHTPGLIENVIVSLFLLVPLLIVLTIIGILVKIVHSKSSHLYVKKIAGFLMTVICSSIIILATLYLPKTINDPKQLNIIECGWPMSFIQFESHMTPPEVWTESCIGWVGNPMDTEKQFFWIPFLTNVAIIFGVIWAVFLLQRFFTLKKGVKATTHTENHN